MSKFINTINTEDKKVPVYWPNVHFENVKADFWQLVSPSNFEAWNCEKGGLKELTNVLQIGVSELQCVWAWSPQTWGGEERQSLNWEHFLRQGVLFRNQIFWPMFLRAATLQKCGSEIFLRFSLPKVSWNLAWNFGEIFRATFSRVWVCDGKFHQNFTSKTVWKTENFTQISLCWGAALNVSYTKIQKMSGSHLLKACFLGTYEQFLPYYIVSIVWGSECFCCFCGC